VLWIRIRKDPHHFGNLDPYQIKKRIRFKFYKLDPDPHHFGNLDPHQINIRNRVKIYKLNPEPDPHQFADVKLKYMEYEHILGFFLGFESFLKL
jgi:hypothetical protein